MAIPTSGLISSIDFLNPACFTTVPPNNTVVNDLSAANNDWSLASAGYTYNASFGSLSLPPSLWLRADLQNLFGTGNVSFTLSFWNYFDSTQYDYLYYNGNYPGSGLHIVTDNANSQYKIIYGPFLGLQANTSTVSMDTWHNITYVYDHTTTTSTVYVDNINVLSFVYSLSQGISSSIYPGVQFNDIWNGTGASPIAIIYCYNRAISTLEVSDIYNQNLARFTPTPPPYVGSVGGRIFAEGLNG